MIYLKNLIYNIISKLIVSSPSDSITHWFNDYTRLNYQIV